LSASEHRIVLDGEYDLTRRDEIARLFDSLDGDGEVVIDLTNVTYLDSTVLRELARLHIRRGGRNISLAGVNENIRRIFKLVGFEEIFDILG
jgi:anti-anti-sigma factor